MTSVPFHLHIPLVLPRLTSYAQINREKCAKSPPSSRAFPFSTSALHSAQAERNRILEKLASYRMQYSRVRNGTPALPATHVGSMLHSPSRMPHSYLRTSHSRSRMPHAQRRTICPVLKHLAAFPARMRHSPVRMPHRHVRRNCPTINYIAVIGFVHSRLTP